ncbi:type 1 glutamine amidotransferase [Microbulbifer variabilis]|uniref:Type 1 glutamine amidotransferase n=1 Tax=Microbulbifer variabilis TaxID=266805 RepID=A0ABY4VFD0_9GAMM|nr:type 1 glutamine amidotransferase [Microbulbifer variabilis]USD22904.1 type 1 glutamine amidotransferase [Microbulbifer variabilis]
MQEPILIIQHEEHEGPGYIADWASQRQIPTILIKPQISTFPNTGFRGVIILGGMMNVKDHISLPWLAGEIHWVKSIINRQAPILGICLGAQILAHTLGADIKSMEQEELGWQPIHWTAEEPLTIDKAFQAHSYYFDIPEGAKRLASSELCQNQAFLYKNNILGLQFHLEWSQQQVTQLFPEYTQKYGSPENNHLANREILFELLNNHFIKRPIKNYIKES